MHNAAMDVEFEWEQPLSQMEEGLFPVVEMSMLEVIEVKLRQSDEAAMLTDASSYALGAALFQGEGANERPIEYASRLLKPPEKNNSTTEREALAVVWSVRKFRGYLKEAQEVQEKEQDRRKTTANSKRRPGPTYAPGDRVYVVTHLVSNASKQRSSKFNPRRDGPYLILFAKGPCSYEVASLEAPGIPFGVYHTYALTPAQEEDQSTPVIPIRRRGRPRKVPPTTTTLRTSVETSKSSEGGDCNAPFSTRALRSTAVAP
jgi:hypothetical protein